MINKEKLSTHTTIHPRHIYISDQIKSIKLNRRQIRIFLERFLKTVSINIYKTNNYNPNKIDNPSNNMLC